MNAVLLPPVRSGFDDQADDLDRLLSEFYQSEMPDPWPTLKPPTAVRPSIRRRRSLWNSRLVLAASMGLLLGTCWMFNDHLGAGNAGPTSIDPINGSAKKQWPLDARPAGKLGPIPVRNDQAPPSDPKR